MSTSSDTQDAQSSAALNTKEDLLMRMLDAFWAVKNNSLTMTSKQRMITVLELLSEEIRGWAPDKEQTRICHLAVTEVADRLLREAHDVPA